MTPSARQAELKTRLTANATGSGIFAVGSWAVEWVEECPSTNTTLGERARGGGRSATVLIADHQSAGRGRLDRTWVTPVASAFTGSVLVPVQPGQAEWLGLIPVLAGLAVLDALGALGALGAVSNAMGACLKWPNDVIVPSLGDRKVAGVLCEAAPGTVVIGIGLNRQRPVDVTGVLAERAAWISDLMGGSDTPTSVDVAVALLSALAGRLSQWDAGPESIVADQRLHLATIGRHVRVELPDRTWTGLAVGVDDHGQLLVVADGETLPRTVMAADVVHLSAID